MAKKMIRPLRSEADYDAALNEIEQYFEKEPKPGTPEADRFDLLALIIEDYERKRWPIEPPMRSMRSVTVWIRSGAPRSMKMGTIRSPWRYDATLEASQPLASCFPLMLTILRCRREHLGRSLFTFTRVLRILLPFLKEPCLDTRHFRKTL